MMSWWQLMSLLLLIQASWAHSMDPEDFGDTSTTTAPSTIAPVMSRGIPCSTNDDCHLHHPLSVCLMANDEFECSVPHQNPLEQGCLKAKLPGWNKQRVCNSDDPPEAVDLGVCRPPEIAEYLEIRIKCQDWESVIFGSWILQIILSEILDVPTTLETGLPHSQMQLYDSADRFEWGTTSNNFEAFQHAASANGDCRTLEQPPQNDSASNNNHENYLNCAHVIPEVWTARSAQVRQLINDNILEPPLSLGALGIEGWYLPKYTAEFDPTLTSWIGLAGEDNRQKLANTFLRPTKWGDYCSLISDNNCSIPDGVAQRAPLDGYESARLFVDDTYTGYFRNTTHNDCSANNNCTGHIGDFPCGWGGSLEAQCFHLGIALESNGDEPYSGGWSYSQLGELWKAANATRNHVMMQWAIPDPIYEAFMGTDYEFVKVTLPAATQTCIQNRINAEHRCVEDDALRLGVPEGVCDETARPLYKLLLKDLFDLTQGPEVTEAIKSPAYSVVSQFTLTELQINEMFKYWQTVNTTSGNSSPREAICQWAVDNIDNLQQYVPRTYPRTIRDATEVSESSKPLFYTTTILGCLATLLVILTSIMVFENRARRVFRYAQIEFLYLLLSGSACVSVGAILTGLPKPNDGVCLAQIWLVGIGYTLELVPLLVKVAAINRLMQAARRMRRANLKRSTLYGGVALICSIMTVFLLCWSLIDPPQKEADFELTDQVVYDDNSMNTETTSTEETPGGARTGGTYVIYIRYFCSSDSDVWQFVMVGWNLILILCATALAFQSRNVKQDFNESIVLSRLIYAHFLFSVLRVMAMFTPPAVANPMLSIIYSLDTIIMLLVYFVPKYMADDIAGLMNGRAESQLSGPVSSRYGVHNSTLHDSEVFPFQNGSGASLQRTSHRESPLPFKTEYNTCSPLESQEFNLHNKQSESVFQREVSVVLPDSHKVLDEQGGIKAYSKSSHEDEKKSG